MYSIADYEIRYKPTNKSGGELKNADYVKLPVNPKGDGLQTLLEHKRGLEVFAVWCLLLEKTTAQKPETRGKLLNFKDESASIIELAKSISLKGKERFVEYSISVLVSMGWLISDDAAEISSEKFPKRAPKLSKGKLSKGKFKPPSLEDVKKYIHDNPEITNVDPNTFWKGFNDSGWIDTRGNPVRNWKLKLRTWSNYASTRTQNPKSKTQRPTNRRLDYAEQESQIGTIIE